MKSNIFPSIFVTIIVMLLLQYFFEIPSRFFQKDAIAPIKSNFSERAIRDEVVVQNTDTGMSTSTQSTTVCTAEYSPVCGIDKHEYSNACEATRANTIVAYTGSCKIEISTTTGSAATGSVKINTTVQKIATGAIKDTPKQIVSVSGEALLTGSDLEISPLFDPKKEQLYSNSALNYRFALPKNVYYQGYGPRNGSSNTLAIALTSTGVDVFETADVRLYYFKTTPALPPEGTPITLNNNGMIIIDGDTSNPKVQNIIDTVSKSAQAE